MEEVSFSMFNTGMESCLEWSEISLLVSAITLKRSPDGHQLPGKAAVFNVNSEGINIYFDQRIFVIECNVYNHLLISKYFINKSYLFDLTQ